MEWEIPKKKKIWDKEIPQQNEKDFILAWEIPKKTKTRNKKIPQQKKNEIEIQDKKILQKEGTKTLSSHSKNEEKTKGTKKNI